MGIYLDTARTSVDWYLANMTHSSGMFRTSGMKNVDGSLLVSTNQNFAEEERVHYSLQLLTELTGNQKYADAARNHLNSFLNLVIDPSTGLPSHGDNTMYNLETNTRGVYRTGQPVGYVDPNTQEFVATPYCTFTENTIHLKPIYDLLGNVGIPLSDAYYDRMCRLPTRPPKDKVRIDDPTKAGESNNPAIGIPVLSVMMLESYISTLNPKYLSMAEAIWNWLKINCQGLTGLFYYKSSSKTIFDANPMYDWAYAYNLGQCLSVFDSQIIRQCATEHFNALLAYSYNPNPAPSEPYWFGQINPNTGDIINRTKGLAPFHLYYTLLGFLECYKRSGIIDYLNIVKMFTPASVDFNDPLYEFPTHNDPPKIELNLELYKVTNDPIYLQNAENIGTGLCNWIINHDYIIYGGLEANSGDPTFDIDNIFHSIKSLLLIEKQIYSPPTTIPVTVTSFLRDHVTKQIISELNVPTNIDGSTVGNTPITANLTQGKHTIKLPQQHNQ